MLKNRKKYFDKLVTIYHSGAFLLTILILFFKTESIENFDYKLLVFMVFFMQIFIFIVFTTPMLILKINYEKHNKDIDFKMDLPNQKFIITNKINGFVMDILFDDIVEIHRIESYNKSFIHIGYMDFFYYELVLKTGESVVITCFLSDNLEKFIHVNKLKVIKKFFPYISESYEV